LTLRQGQAPEQEAQSVEVPGERLRRQPTRSWADPVLDGAEGRSPWLYDGPDRILVDLIAEELSAVVQPED
jgi:hypothetical protein